MSGQLALRDASSGAIDAKRRDHLKMAVQVACTEDNGHCLIATAGWDLKVLIYAPSVPYLEDGQSGSASDDFDFFGDPIHTITLTTVPESILFVRHPDTHELYHLITADVSQQPIKFTIKPSGRQNLAPHSNAWVAFTPSCLRISPKDPTLLAVATSHLPHMKLIILRLLFPSQPDPSCPAQNHTPASAARRDLALQDREDAAISLHVTTLAPQTPYSTPQVVWRPDATGVWVNGDDGVIRGLEVKTGKIVSVLRGHEAASKVRTLWAGRLRSQDGDGREVLVSGGFDKQVLIWDCEAKSE
jgi:WD40 repeat protein